VQGSRGYTFGRREGGEDSIRLNGPRVLGTHLATPAVDNPLTVAISTYLHAELLTIGDLLLYQFVNSSLD
jgi:hypothetical protein